MAFKYDKIKLTWHQIYIVLLYIRAFVGIIYGAFNYFISFSQLDSHSYYFTDEKLSTLTFSYIALLFIDLIRIILEFKTAKKIKEFLPAGYRLNNYLHAFIVASFIIMGIVRGYILEDSEGYTATVGFILAVVWGLAVWLPIYCYYSNRSELFSNENPNNNLQVALVNMPSDILEACEAHSSNEEDYNNYIDSLLSSATVTRKQAEALQTLYYPSEEEYDDYIDHISLDDIENLLSSNKITQEQAEALQMRSYLNKESIKQKETIESTSDLEPNSKTYCRKCGIGFPSDSTFCNKCGISITEKKIKKEIICDSCEHSIPKDRFFCPYCENQLPKKRKFQKNRSFIISVSILSVLLLILSTLNIIQFVKAQNDKETIEIYKNANNEKLDKISELNNEIEEWKEKAGDYSFIIYDLNFYKKHAAIIPDDGKKLYHTYDCDKLDHSKSFWIYNENIAYSLGNDPCPFCWDKET